MRPSFLGGLLGVALLACVSPALADDDAGEPAPAGARVPGEGPARPPPPAYGEGAGPGESGPGQVRSAPPAYVAEPAPSAPPLGHRGFQLALRSGVSLPFGSAKQSFAGEATSPEHWSSSMGDLAGTQIPVMLDVGGKPNKHVFIGGYFGYARGFSAGRLADACGRPEAHLDCYSTNVRLGAEVHYVFTPNDWLTPWVGYGFGYAWMTSGDGSREARLRGFDFAHLMAGLDFRFSRVVGLGVFVDYALGTYAHQALSADAPTVGEVDGSISGRTVHQWLTIGPRVVIMP